MTPLTSRGARVAERRRWTMLDRAYFVGIGIKGVDGAIELLVGLLLLIVPGLAHLTLSAAVAEAVEQHTTIRVVIAGYLENLDDRLLQTGLVFVILFLVLHGLVKLVLVYCLMRRFHRVYPYALTVLVLFLCYQLYTLITAPTIGMAFLTILDAVIIMLVYQEYRELKSRRPVTSRG